VDPALFTRATVFADEIAQSITIGEAQHAVSKGLIAEADITPIGAVINGAHAGRVSETEITLFDGTGVGLQDLAVASVAAKLAREQGLVTPSTLG
ncbi:MAG: ornithine cyclodeaminase family protein, partial [Roseovarius sp.]